MISDSLSNKVAFLQENPDLIAQYVAALERIRAFQPRRLEWFREQGIVFDLVPGDDDRWQEIAFQIYTDLCEIESIATAVVTE